MMAQTQIETRVEQFPQQQVHTMNTSSKSESSLSLINSAAIIGSAVVVPLFLGWVGKNPLRNIQTTVQILKALRGMHL
jgi:hypothetical protein